MLKFLTAGESHGIALMGILQGLPANLKIDINTVNLELSARQVGHGRGARMAIETDVIKLLAGIRGGVTTGAPIGFLINNKDHANWQDIIGANATKLNDKKLTAVRPGHADLAGCIKYNQSDARNILERASARSTATSVAIGAICSQYLECLGITIKAEVLSIGGQVDESKIKKAIDKAKQDGDTLGGEVKLVVSGMPVGIGSHIASDARLEFNLMAHLGAINSVKSVSVGNASDYKTKTGLQVHDQMYVDTSGKIIRKTNNAGGIEGGISNGEDIVITLIAKPIPTVMCGLDTVDIATKKPTKSATERSDVCAVEAVAIVAKNVLAYALAEQVINTIGGDTMAEAVERVAKKREPAI